MLSDRRSTVLLVEDNLDEELLIMRSIRRSGVDCQILSAHSTTEALTFLECPSSPKGRDGDLPNVILTDLRVGPLGGAEMVSLIRNDPVTRAIPIVVMSSAASESQIKDLYVRGANSFIEKPLDSDDFAEAIQAIVRYWGHLNAHGLKVRGGIGRP